MRYCLSLVPCCLDGSLIWGTSIYSLSSFLPCSCLNSKSKSVISIIHFSIRDGSLDLTLLNIGVGCYYSDFGCSY